MYVCLYIILTFKWIFELFEDRLQALWPLPLSASVCASQEQGYSQITTVHINISQSSIGMNTFVYHIYSSFVS